MFGVASLKIPRNYTYVLKNRFIVWYAPCGDFDALCFSFASFLFTSYTGCYLHLSVRSFLTILFIRLILRPTGRPIVCFLWFVNCSMFLASRLSHLPPFWGGSRWGYHSPLVTRSLNRRASLLLAVCPGRKAVMCPRKRRPTSAMSPTMSRSLWRAGSLGQASGRALM